ncbi:MAG: response regulator transcription factor [Ardenticatenaceae bacterium]|nr:response regulator transcription factor [Ardenticatenaceae bacterium]MCB9443868.1 response regulator transcription factor [Ardenticatenaceae bacterium]
MSGTKSILVVDDEPNLRKTLAMILQRAGYVVTTAGNADEAHRLLRAGAYGLVFLDIKMPDKSGLTLLAEIRELYPDMPIVLLTAHASLDSAIEAVRRGANDYLLKPIDPPQILERVSQVLAKQEQPRRRREIFDEMQGLLAELANIEGGGNVVDGGTAVIDPSRYLQRGAVRLDLHTRQVLINGNPVTLTPTAFDYLVTLVRHSPETVTYKKLVKESQGYEPSLIEAKEVARWRIHELRKAIEADSRKPDFIITVRGIGYRLVA